MVDTGPSTQPYPEIEKVFYRVIYTKAEELDLKIHAAGNVEDHAHIVLSIPPKIAIAT
jgi:putative transposase